MACTAHGLAASVAHSDCLASSSRFRCHRSKAPPSMNGKSLQRPMISSKHARIGFLPEAKLSQSRSCHMRRAARCQADSISNSGLSTCSSSSSGSSAELAENKGPSARTSVRVGVADASKSVALTESDVPGRLEGQVADRVDDMARAVDAFVRFTRPHTMIGTAISVTSVSLLAVSSSADLSMRFVTGLLQALVPALLMNVYIVGLNQVFDVAIDKVNKPYLPLASGDFSLETGVRIITVCAVASIALGLTASSPALMATLLASAALGTAYSVDLPFLRWKRFPVVAAACILAVRAVMVQLGFFVHMQAAVLQRPLLLSPQLLFATAFMCTFSIVIALFKDIPDVEGDRVFGVRSLSVRIGQKKVYWICVGILLASYAAAVAFSLSSYVLWSKILSVGGHSVAALLLWRRAQQVDYASPDSISSVYMFVWKLFYAEYLFLPLLR